MQFWFDTWPVRYNVLWSLTDILLGFCGSSGCFFGDSQSFFFKRKVNSFHFNVMKINHVIDDFLKKCPDTWNCLIFVSSMKFSFATGSSASVSPSSLCSSSDVKASSLFFEILSFRFPCKVLCSSLSPTSGLETFSSESLSSSELLLQNSIASSKGVFLYIFISLFEL